MTNKYTKVPPHSTEAEQYVLGSLMYEPCYMRFVPFLHMCDFYRNTHKLFFKAMVFLNKNNNNLNLVNICEYIKKNERINISSESLIYFEGISKKVADNLSDFLLWAYKVKHMSDMRSISEEEEIILEKHKKRRALINLFRLVDESINYYNERAHCKDKDESEKEVNKVKCCFSCGQKIPVK